MHDSLTTVNQWPEGMGKGSEGGREVAKGWGNGDICNRVKNKNKVKKKKPCIMESLFLINSILGCSMSNIK